MVHTRIEGRVLHFCKATDCNRPHRNMVLPSHGTKSDKENPWSKGKNLKLKSMKEENFLTIIREGEVLEGTALSILKGGENEYGCPHLQSCGCHKGNACGGREACNSLRPGTEVPSDTIPGK